MTASVARGRRRSERAALAAARRVLRGRAGLPSRGDLAYGIYLGVMVVIIAVAPVVRALILALSDALPIAPLAAVAAALAGFIALASLAGAQTGPARARLPEVDLLLSSALPRRRTLARRLLRDFALAALAGALLVAAVLSAYALRGVFAPALAAGLLAAGAGLGALAALAMLIGQQGRGPRWSLAAVLGAVCIGLALAAVAPGPGPDAQSLLPAAWPILPLLAALGLVAALCAPAIAERLRGETLREQAARLDLAGVLAGTGELRVAAARLGAPVRTARRWRWRMPRRIGAAIVTRDLVGVVRAPARSLAALAGALGAGAILGGPALGAPSPLLATAPGAVAALLAYASLGPWCRGLRAAAETVGGSPLAPLPPSALLARHLVVPGALGALASAIGAALAGVLGGPGAGPAALGGALLAVAALVLRLAGALKGPLPQALLAPVPTPAGDFSGVTVLLWSLDGIIVAAILGAILTAAAVASAAAGAVAAVLALVALCGWAAVRLRSASAAG